MILFIDLYALFLLCMIKQFFVHFFFPYKYKYIFSSAKQQSQRGINGKKLPPGDLGEGFATVDCILQNEKHLGLGEHDFLELHQVGVSDQAHDLALYLLHHAFFLHHLVLGYECNRRTLTEYPFLCRSSPWMLLLNCINLAALLWKQM